MFYIFIFQFIIMTNIFATIGKRLFYVIEFFDGIKIILDNWVIQDETLIYWKVKLDQRI